VVPTFFAGKGGHTTLSCKERSSSLAHPAVGAPIELEGNDSADGVGHPVSRGGSGEAEAIEMRTNRAQRRSPAREHLAIRAR
jgi:hypothetical protein